MRAVNEVTLSSQALVLLSLTSERSKTLRLIIWFRLKVVASGFLSLLVVRKGISKKSTEEQSPEASDSLRSLLRSIAVNSTVMTSFTDYGYLKLFYVFYNLSHLERYPNFFVTVIDMKSYIVFSVIVSPSRM